VGLDDVTAAAVAAIVAESDAGGPGLCSGVLVAPRFVLTAAHCAAGAAPSALRVSFGSSAAPFAHSDRCGPPARAYAAVALERDPDADVMLVELASDVSGARVVPVASTSPVAGQTAVIAGFGLDGQGAAGERSFAATTVVGVGAGITDDSGAEATGASDGCPGDGDAGDGACAAGPLLVTVNSGAEAGACAGDSGGPLFVRAASGWQVAGLLSEGSPYCTGEDVFVDVASVANWIRARVGS